MSINNSSVDSALLALADGSVFYGRSCGAIGTTTGEVVFNTAMTGYQEIFTDPSYARQIVTLTCPHVGIVGTNNEDEESSAIHMAGAVLKNVPATVSSWRCQQSLPAYFKQHGVVAIEGIDTRRLTSWLRRHGSQGGCIQAGRVDVEQAKHLAKSFPGLAGLDLAQEVSTREAYDWQEGLWQQAPRTCNGPKVAVMDYGVKRNILRMLAQREVQVRVFPAKTQAAEVRAWGAKGVVLSNGPGDPEPCDYAITAIQDFFASKTPLLGICLGHQLLALAAGAQTTKMKFGHHGANHPVKDLASGRVFITSQNHCYSVVTQVPPTLRITHQSLFDNSIQGIAHKNLPVFGFQGHPEASPGPQEMSGLFDEFIKAVNQV